MSSEWIMPTAIQHKRMTYTNCSIYRVVDCIWNVMAHAQKPDFVFRRKGRIHLNRRGRQFSRLLATDLCASAVVMLDTPCSEVVWRVLTTHSIRQFSPSLPLPLIEVNFWNKLKVNIASHWVLLYGNFDMFTTVSRMRTSMISRCVLVIWFMVTEILEEFAASVFPAVIACELYAFCCYVRRQWN